MTENSPEGAPENPATINWYRRYYAEKGEHRNNVVMNSGARWQFYFSMMSYIEAFAYAMHALSGDDHLNILDVGCGEGDSLIPLIHIADERIRLTGLDIQGARIERARRRLPQCEFFHASATNMPVPAGSFKIVTASTVFVQITDDGEARRIADEMRRALHPDGMIVLRDWTAPQWLVSRFAPHYRTLTRHRVSTLFPKMVEHRRVPGALLPPLGRFLGRHAPRLYQIASLLPLAVGQHSYVLGHR